MANKSRAKTGLPDQEISDLRIAAHFDLSQYKRPPQTQGHQIFSGRQPVPLLANRGGVPLTDSEIQTLAANACNGDLTLQRLTDSEINALADEAWNGDPTLWHEFLNSFERYAALCRGAFRGRLKIYQGGAGGI